MAETGITLSPEEMRAFSINRNQVISRREERARRTPRVFDLVCTVLEAEEIVENCPEVRIISPALQLNKGQMLSLKSGIVHGPKRGFRHDPNR